MGMTEKASDLVSGKGFTGIEIGLAVVGVAAAAHKIYSVVTGARGAVAKGRNFGSDLADGLDKLKDDPKFKKVMEMFGKEALDEKEVV